MLWRVGNVSEALNLKDVVPDDVHNDIVRDLVILDDEYGKERNYLVDGGYTLIADTKEDVLMALKVVGEGRPCEWVIRLGTSGWTNTLFLLGDDFGVVLYALESVLPAALLNQMEEDKQ